MACVMCGYGLCMVCIVFVSKCHTHLSLCQQSLRYIKHIWHMAIAIGQTGGVTFFQSKGEERKRMGSTEAKNDVAIH